MEPTNLSPSGVVLPLATAINGNGPVDENTGVMQAEGGASRNVRVFAGVALAVSALAATGAGIAAMCIDNSSQTEKLGLGIAAGVLGGLTSVGGALAMKYA
ncbi:SepZ/EspZ family type III secretion system protein [Citrobacter rodentium]|jgi:SepZ.|uniref:T3SS effector protein EspZ n=2 Tax=Citrobacter rodentium TaxID=67825 RepID=D2TKF8_CITRI|nr:SepZ/EspZ family type III secretion system protein [Citrobacter rodentium]AAL06366.1 SepZ [Citrobacter rodentium]QBY29432.1 type III secretion system protein SepZ [Citrobacter rodentium]UHO33170.1 SepZ/EspZ family type III secretion system protein [Citrobacter rodentium NBRC 105723 = DSM 16636]CBG89728.1 T3SS effector protein EspZ [Citrobacter rodentium ICC168]HAT8015388.1 type III secretion system protein SepZ [Citrobacter rodentium NBRC 105723 = DSM 16636]